MQKSGEDVKLLIRLAPNLVHMCRFIWEWIYAKHIAPRDTRGHLGGGFRGSNIKVTGSCQTTGPIGTNFGSRRWIHLGIYKSPLNTPGGMAGGLGGHKFKSLGKLSNGWTDWHQIWYTSVDSSGNGHRLKTIRPTIPRGDILGGFMGSTIQNSRKCGQTAGPIGNKLCTCKMQMNLGKDTG